jgi:hypothetical protein
MLNVIVLVACACIPVNDVDATAYRRFGSMTGISTTGSMMGSIFLRGVVE